MIPAGGIAAWATLLLAALVSAGEQEPWDTTFVIRSDPNLEIDCEWNARERAAGLYSPAAWPQGALATQRALLFAARQLFRDEWKISRVVDAEHPGGGFVQLAEAETGYHKKHEDHPPHVHINFIWPKWSGHVNTHFYTTEDGKVSKPLILWTVPGCTAGDRNPPAGQWWAELDQLCKPVWWQTWTEDGAILLKRTETAPIYKLRARDIKGDLGGADVFVDTKHIYSVDITEYDPVGMRLVVHIGDLRARKLITETFLGDPAMHKTLIKHTVEEEPLDPVPPPARRGVPRPSSSK